MNAAASGAAAMALALLVVQIIGASGLIGTQAKRTRIQISLAAGALALLLACLILDDASRLWSAAVVLIATLLIGGWARWRGVADRRGIAVAAVGGLLALAFLGASHLLARERTFDMAVGTSRSFQGWTIELRGVAPAVGPDWSGLAADLAVRRGDEVHGLAPARETRLRPERTSNPPVALERWDGVLGARLGPETAREEWAVALSWRPFVALIPFGAMLAVLGVLFALLLRPLAIRWRARRMARAGQWWA